jgi:hypothetical protein
MNNIKHKVMNETLEKIAYFLNDLGIDYYYDSSKKMLILDGRIDSNKCRKLQEFESDFSDVYTHWSIFQIEISLI